MILMWLKVTLTISGDIMRNLSDFQLIRKINNQVVHAYYYPPKKEKNINDLATEKGITNWQNLKPSEIRNLYGTDYLNSTDYIDGNGIPFIYKSGVEDVYKKSGYENIMTEYAQRNSTTKRQYKITTDMTHIDFKAGGRIELPGEEPFLLIDVVDLTNDVSTQNQLRVYETFQRKKNVLNQSWKKSPKALTLA